VRLPHGARARLAPLDRTACVLFVVWAAVVVERFVHLA
jgi:hypothetical protein